jgi:2-haloacid dehalogenase
VAAHFVLDVNETLSDMGPVGDVLDRHGAPRALADAWFAAVLRDGFALSLHRRAPAFLNLCRDGLRVALHGLDRLDAPVPEVVDDVLATMSRLGVHDDVSPGLRALADAGHTLTAFSNGSEAAIRGLLERSELSDVVAHVLSVEGGPVWKPHPDAYASAAARLGASPSDLTMVAVHPWDLDGAGSAGFRTAWLDRGGSPWPDSFRPPDERVRRLTDLGRVHDRPDGAGR